MESKDKYEKKLIQNIISCIMNYGGDKYLSSIVLTGSLGRGEATYTLNSDGTIKLKSDIEIALIHSGKVKKKSITKLIKCVNNEFEEDLNLMPISEKRVKRGDNFNFTIKKPKFKTLFTYDLYNGSYTIWGTDFIAKKKIHLNDIDIYEAKRLIGNRIGELTYLTTNVKDNDEYLQMQWKGKLILAIGTAWLICENKYVSSYKSQYNNIKDNKDEIESILGREFFKDYDMAFKFLRKNGHKFDVSQESTIKYINEINSYFINKQIKNSKVNTFSRSIKYYLKYVKTGMKFGIINFEDNILQTLIDYFCTNNSKLIDAAKVWHRVLY